MSLRAALERVLPDLGLSPDAAATERLGIHERLLHEWNPIAALVSAGDAHGEALHRHYLDAVRALPYLLDAHRVVDVGSGGGFPGLIWAALRPDLEVMAIESSRRKAAFLLQAIHEMELPRAAVRAVRVERPEDLVAGHADLLTTRATGHAKLLFAAARLLPPPVRVVLFPSAEAAAGLHSRPPAGFQPAGSTALDRGGEILVLDRIVPRGTS